MYIYIYIYICMYPQARRVEPLGGNSELGGGRPKPYTRNPEHKA